MTLTRAMTRRAEAVAAGRGLAVAAWIGELVEVAVAEARATEQTEDTAR